MQDIVPGRFGIAGVAAGCAARRPFILVRHCPATLCRCGTWPIRTIEAGFSQHISDI
jgi:hypothetical protein